MTKKRANKLFDSNIFWAVVSLLAALCIWVYMTDTQEEPISVTLSGVEVVFEGEDVLQSQRGLVITDVSAETVDVTISGTRINIGRLSSEDVKAVIDVSRASSTSNYNMGYTLRFPSGVDADAVRLERSSPSTISFQVTRMDERQFPVVAAFKGSVADGYVLGDIEYEPATISVRGPQSVLDSIEDVYAEVTLQDVNSTRTVESGFILRDADGNEISKEGLEFDFDTISVTIPISKMKTVPIYVTYIEGSGATRENTSATLDVKEITIAGDAASVDGINRIEVGPIDLTDFELTAEYDLPIVLPNDVENVSGIETVHVEVEINGLEVRSFTVTNIDYTGLPEQYKAELVTHSLTVRIRGTRENLDRLNDPTTSIRAVADLSGTTATGTMETPNVDIRVDGVLNTGAVGTYRLTFNISA